MGIWGPRTLALDLKRDLGEWLRYLQLELSQNKTLITSARRGRALFLGTMVTRRPRVTLKRNVLGHLRRATSGNLFLEAPICSIVKRLLEKGFLKKAKGGVKPQPLKQLIPLPIKDLLLRFRAILAGFLNFYCFADNIKALKKIYSILRACLVSTISEKEDRSHREVLEDMGPKLELKIQKRNREVVTLDFACPPLNRQPMKFLGTEVYSDPLAAKDMRISKVSALKQPCSNCGSFTEVEMHHVKHIKTIPCHLSSFEKAMARINRKQVPLCHKCHVEVHAGRYCGFSLRYFYHLK